MLLRVLRDILTRKPPAGLPIDEAGYDRLMRDLVDTNKGQDAFAVYDAAVSAAIHPGDPAFDSAYRHSMAVTGSTPYPLRRRSRLLHLYHLLEEIVHLEGEIAECGCFRGLSSHLILSALKRADPGFSGSGYHVFDSFEGLSEPGAEDRIEGDDPAAMRLRQMCQRGWFAASLDMVKQGLAEFPAVVYHPGWIPHSFLGLPELRYRFVHLDLDLHDPTLAALEYFHPRLVPGAIVVCDDYSWPGGRKAIDGFCARHGVDCVATPHGQAVLRRNR